MSSIDRPLSGAVRVFDLGAEAEVAEAPAGGRGARTLLKEGPLRLTLVRVSAGGAIPEHHADGPIAVQALEGTLEFVAAGETHVLEPGRLLTLGAGVPHSVRSAGGALFLLTVAKPTA